MFETFNFSVFSFVSPLQQPQKLIGIVPLRLSQAP
jgi:hypothetical protein